MSADNCEPNRFPNEWSPPPRSIEAAHSRAGGRPALIGPGAKPPIMLG